MRHTIRTCLCLLLLSGVFIAGSQAEATTHDPEKGTSVLTLRDGGDVLRPERDTPGDYFWFIGLDAGLTYSMFQNGPINYLIPHPYVPSLPWFGNADEGSGLGLLAGITLDFPLGDIFGIVLKGYYHTRAGSFDEMQDIGFTHDLEIPTTFNNKTDWTFNYLSVDLLARINFGSTPLYGLIGPSYSSLSSNKIELDQTILTPEDLWYWEDELGNTPNFQRQGKTDGEIDQILDSRTDLKLGLGYWLELSDGLMLTPEVSVALPFGKLINEDEVDPDDIEAGLVDPDFNMTTIFFTVGLRWRID